MASADRMIDELANIHVDGNKSLKHLVETTRKICRELAFVLNYQAEAIEGALSTVKPVDAKFGSMSARFRARAVAKCFRLGATAVIHTSRLATKAWVLFLKHYAPELALVQTKKKPRFTIEKG